LQAFIKKLFLPVFSFFHFNKWVLGIIAAVVFLLTSCTTILEIDDLPQPNNEIVVEGTIEINEPPYILLTKNSPYFGGITVDDLSQYFIHNAIMKVWTGNDTVALIEFCIKLLPVEAQIEILESLGYSVSDTSDIPNVCIYTVPNIINYFINGDTTGVFIGKEHQTYHLHIEADGKVLTSVTTIPGLVPLDPLTIQPHPDANKDSLVSVYINFKDPDTLGNYFRYSTQRNDEPFYYPISQSVYDDRIINSEYISLPLERGMDPQAEIDNDTWGYFWKGDTVTLKWSNIDKRSYDFWSTLENDGGDSPFSSPTIIKTNINGGLGVWCGYASVYSTVIVPE